MILAIFSSIFLIALLSLDEESQSYSFSSVLSTMWFGLCGGFTISLAIFGLFSSVVPEREFWQQVRSFFAGCGQFMQQDSRRVRRGRLRERHSSAPASAAMAGYPQATADVVECDQLQEGAGQRPATDAGANRINRASGPASSRAAERVGQHICRGPWTSPCASCSAASMTPASNRSS